MTAEEPPSARDGGSPASDTPSPASDTPSPASDAPSPASDAPSQAPGGGPARARRAPTIGDLFWVGTACAIAVVAPGGIGFAIDDAIGTLPWFTVAGLAFGVLSAVLLAVNQFRKYV